MELQFTPGTHLLCGLLLVARLGDILSTRLATPKLLLETNLIAKKLGWPFIAITSLVCLIPYFNPCLGIGVLVPSLLVSASNISKLWMIRAIGEESFAELMVSLARKKSLGSAIAYRLLSAFFLVLAGWVLLWVGWRTNAGVFFFAIGMILYGVVMGLHGSLYHVRLHKKAVQSPPAC